jgi:hypothetical protein
MFSLLFPRAWVKFKVDEKIDEKLDDSSPGLLLEFTELSSEVELAA